MSEIFYHFFIYKDNGLEEFDVKVKNRSVLFTHKKKGQTLGLPLQVVSIPIAIAIPTLNSYPINETAFPLHIIICYG